MAPPFNHLVTAPLFELGAVNAAGAVEIRIADKRHARLDAAFGEYFGGGDKFMHAFFALQARRQDNGRHPFGW